MARKRRKNRNVSNATPARELINTQHGEKTVSELQSFYNDNPYEFHDPVLCRKNGFCHIRYHTQRKGHYI